MSRKICEYLPDLCTGDRLELLFYCIDFMFYAGLSPLDRYLEGVLNGKGSVGGDPGWRLSLEERESAINKVLWDEFSASQPENFATCYEAWALSEISMLGKEVAYYSIKEVRGFIFLAIKNIASKNPHLLAEVNHIIDLYKLG